MVAPLCSMVRENNTKTGHHLRTPDRASLHRQSVRAILKEQVTNEPMFIITLFPTNRSLALAYQVTSAVWRLAGRLSSRLLQNPTGSQQPNQQTASQSE
jgi:hypothetical protein